MASGYRPLMEGTPGLTPVRPIKQHGCDIGRHARNRRPGPTISLRKKVRSRPADNADHVPAERRARSSVRTLQGYHQPGPNRVHQPGRRIGDTIRPSLMVCACSATAISAGSARRGKADAGNRISSAKVRGAPGQRRWKVLPRENASSDLEKKWARQYEIAHGPPSIACPIIGYWRITGHLERPRPAQIGSRLPKNVGESARRL